MSSTAKSKPKSNTRGRVPKRPAQIDDVSDDENKENMNNDDNPSMTSKKKPNTKKRPKQRSPSPEPVKTKQKTMNTATNLTRSRSAAVLTSVDLSHTTTTKKQKKTADSKSKRRNSSLSPVLPSKTRSPPPESRTNQTKTRSTKAIPRVTTTPVAAKNIRHRSVSSSSITTAVNKRKTVKKNNAHQPRSKSSAARPSTMPVTVRKTIRRQTTYLTIPSVFNGNSKGGQVLAVGDNGMTQLGLKSAIAQRQNPQPVLIPEPIIQIAAGPLHSVCLTDKNNLFTFGCNDEHALGRIDKDDEDDDDADPFEQVDLSKVMDSDEESIVQIVAGDSHTLVLSDAGKVYGWGTFRSSTNGIYGLVRKSKMAKRPVPISLPEKIVKLASGYDFVLFLSETGRVYSCGNGETGQLGRLSRYAAEDGRRGGIERLITPAPIVFNRSSIKEKYLVFDDIFAGAHHYFLKVQGQSYILAGGLNNFHQLGLQNTDPVFFPTYIPSLDGYQWAKFAGGLHHTLGLTSDGKVYALGRSHEGQLGIDHLTVHLAEPTLIPNIPKAVDIACGNHVSFIIDQSGKVYSFGAGTSLQHGHGQQDIITPRQMSSKYMDIKKIVNIAVGAQHTLFLSKE